MVYLLAADTAVACFHSCVRWNSFTWSDSATHSSVSASHSLSLYSCDCLCVCFHSSSQRFFLPLLLFCTPNFPLLFSLSLFIPLHSLFTCIVNKKSRLLADYQRRQWQKRQTIFFLLLFYSNHEWHWIQFEIESTLILIKWMWGKEGTKKRYIYDDKPNTYRERYE